MAHLLSSQADYLKLLIRDLADLLFPPLCPLCKKNIKEIEICPDCLESFKPLSSPRCSICGVQFKTDSGEDHPCGTCIKNRPSFDMAASVFLYNEPMREAVHLFKYKAKSILSRPLGNSLAQHPLAEEDYDVVLPVPLHIKRLRQRGYNQSQLLAVELGRARGIKVDPW
ncbi:MAG: ComF family protein, partial [Proteobacteria bacterium]|nr:ComF family protein [Pseudomonadota bacterium]